MNSRSGIIAADAMCGGGGSTTGIRRFFEREHVSVKRFVCVNHDPDAIDVHSWNHPECVHYCQNFESVNLQQAFPEGYCDFCWASTSCTQHSRARGGKPIEDQKREGPWHLLHFATEIHVARFAIENVPEFLDWAPLDSRGRPLKSKRGETFRAWRSAFEGIGYKFEYRIDNAADFGAGTTRERFIGLLTRKKKIVWAMPTHSRDGHGDLFTGQREKWRGAREFLDFSIPSKPIVGRRIPLSPPTLSRGWHGIRTFWGAGASRVFAPDIRDAAIAGHAYAVTELAKAQDGPKPARRKKNGKVVKLPQRSSAAKANDRTRREKRILRLQKMIERYEVLILGVRGFLETPVPYNSSALQPFLVNLRGTSRSQIASSASSGDTPVPAVSAGGGHAGVVDVRLTSLVGGNRAHNVPKSEDEPTGSPTTATGGGLFLVTPVVRTLILGQHGGGVARPEEQPHPSLTQDCASQAIVPIVTPFYGEKNGKPRASRTVDSPLGTASTEPRFALLEGFVIPPSSEAPPKVLDNPLGSPTTTQRGHQFVEPWLVTVNHPDDPPSSRVSTLDEPIGGRTQRNGDAVVEPYLVAHFGEREGQSPRIHSTGDPAPSPTQRGAGDLMQAALERVEQIDPALRERLLIGEDGQIYVAHLHFRMLNPKKELSLVMGFPKTYLWPDSNTVVTKLVGNAVHVDWADAVVSAFLSDLIPQKRNSDDEAAA